MLRKSISLLILLCLLIAPAQALERAQLRAQWQEIEREQSADSPYAEVPDPRNFSSGSLSLAAQANALHCLNFLRGLCGLSPVTVSPLYTLRAQNGAMLLAAGDRLEHEPAQPEGMSDELYASALAGTSMGNIAKFNWMRPEILTEGVTYFARDDGETNLAALGHRRWLLNPEMAETGFGLANAESGMSYICMYAVDGGNADAEWDFVAWPSGGCFPVEMMRRDLAWSVSLNDEIYDANASRPRVRLREDASGAEFVFDLTTGKGDGYCHFNRENYGSGSCVIFRPDVAAKGLEEYVQNQRWSVEITGLRTTDGEETSIEYDCEMVSLHPQDAVNVELNRVEAQMKVGDSLQLSASVIPEYADDLRVFWSSSDERVATVSETGRVTALAAGECTIRAASANHRSDACEIRVRTR